MSKANAVGFRRGAMLLAIGMATVASASDWYVDPVNGSDAYDGTASNVVSGTVGPCRTLFYVATKKAEANDTVWLMPGVYAEGSGTAADDTTRRLRVSNRPGLKFRDRKSVV